MTFFTRWPSVIAGAAFTVLALSAIAAGEVLLGEWLRKRR